jgi:hypothetical protein
VKSLIKCIHLGGCAVLLPGASALHPNFSVLTSTYLPVLFE